MHPEIKLKENDEEIQSPKLIAEVLLTTILLEQDQTETANITYNVSTNSNFWTKNSRAYLNL